MKMIKNFKLSAVIISVLLVLLVFNLSILSISVISMRFGKENVGGEDSSQFQYQYYERDNENDRSYFGSVQLYKEIEDEYLSYEGSNGNQVLISNFGQGEFQCTGSCHCRNRRGATTTTLSKGVVHLVAAASLLTALGTAKGSFERSCEATYGETCQSGVLAEVQNCESVTDLSPSTSGAEDYEEPPEDSEDAGIGLGNFNEPKYYCYGSCEQFRQKSGSDFLGQGEIENFRCERITFQKEVEVFENIVDEVTQGHVFDAAVSTFMYDLGQFCESQSRVQVDTGIKLDFGGQTMNGVVERTACQGSSGSIKCRRLV